MYEPCYSCLLGRVQHCERTREEAMEGMSHCNDRLEMESISYISIQSPAASHSWWSCPVHHDGSFLCLFFVGFFGFFPRHFAPLSAGTLAVPHGSCSIHLMRSSTPPILPERRDVKLFASHVVSDTWSESEFLTFGLSDFLGLPHLPPPHRRTFGLSATIDQINWLSSWRVQISWLCGSRNCAGSYGLWLLEHPHLRPRQHVHLQLFSFSGPTNFCLLYARTRAHSRLPSFPQSHLH